MRKSTGKTPGARHQTGIERANRRGECDDCMAVAVELFRALHEARICAHERFP